MPYKSKYRKTEDGRECTKCRNFKLWKEFHKNTSDQTGYQTRCKECINELVAIRRSKTRKSPVYIINSEGRECTNCNNFLYWSNFSVHKLGANGRNSRCKECVRSQKRKNDKSARDADLQTCWVCNLTKPRKDFYRATGSVGRQFFCKECHCNRLTEVIKYFPTSLCTGCKETKAREEFYPNPNFFDGCHAKCKECAKALKNLYYINNREKSIACVLSSRAKNPEGFKEYGRRYNKENPEKVKANNHRRRARLLGAATDEGLTVIALREIHGDWCFFCGVKMVFSGWNRKKIDPRYATHEHLTSLNRGGDNTFANSVLACHRCNTRKQDRSLEKFLEILKKEKEIK